jgi:hypothetical protein
MFQVRRSVTPDVAGTMADLINKVFEEVDTLFELRETFFTLLAMLKKEETLRKRAFHGLEIFSLGKFLHLIQHSFHAL